MDRRSPIDAPSPLGALLHPHTLSERVRRTPFAVLRRLPGRRGSARKGGQACPPPRPSFPPRRRTGERGARVDLPRPVPSGVPTPHREPAQRRRGTPARRPGDPLAQRDPRAPQPPLPLPPASDRVRRLLRRRAFPPRRPSPRLRGPRPTKQAAGGRRTRKFETSRTHTSRLPFQEVLS